MFKAIPFFGRIFGFNKHNQQQQKASTRCDSIQETSSELLSMCYNLQGTSTQNHLHSELDQGISLMKGLLKSRKQECHHELFIASEIAKRTDSDLKRVSPNMYHKWRKLQSMSNFLTVLRRIIHEIRHYGIKAAKNRQLSLQLKTLVGDKPQLRKKCLLYPHSAIIKVRSIVYNLIIVYLLVSLPLDLAFLIKRGSNTSVLAEYIIVALLSADIMLSFFVVVQKDRILIEEHSKIAIHYLTRWFIFDLLAVVPFDLVSNDGNLRFKKLLILPRLLKHCYFTLNKLTSSSDPKPGVFIHFLKNFFAHSQSVYLVLSMILTLLFMHISACLWIYSTSDSPDQWMSR